jgi:hypothetical protein
VAHLPVRMQLIVAQSHLFIVQDVLDSLLPFGGLPCSQSLMIQIVLLRYWMCACDHFQTIPLTDEIAEVIAVWARRIAHDKTGGQVDDIGAVLFHLFRRVLDISTGATITGGITGQFHFDALVELESTFTVAQSPEAFTACAGMVAITNDDSNPLGVRHDYLLLPHNPGSLETNNLQFHNSPYPSYLKRGGLVLIFFLLLF